MAVVRAPLPLDVAYTPERDAFGYPGPDLGHSFLLTPRAALPLAEPERGALEDSVVASGAGEPERLEAVLERLGAPPLAERLPVVAFGANRNPNHVAHRFAALERFALPILRVRLRGAAVVYPAYVGLYGVMTSTLLASPETVSHVHLLLCDPDELRALHIGEGAGDRHDFGVLDDCAVTLLTGRELPAPYCYSCARGVARIDGVPRRLARVAVDTSPVGEAAFDDAMDWMVRRARAAGLPVASHADIQQLVLDGRRDELLHAIRADAVAHGLAFTALSSPDDPHPVPDRRLGGW